jgi:hypothetical protein
MQRSALYLLAILMIHIGLGLGFSLGTPIFEAPDEANHYLFVRHLQLHRELPVQRLDRDGPRAHHPPLYYLLAALISAWVPVQGNAERIDMALNPHVWYRYGDPDIDNKATFVHYRLDERWPFRGQALAVHVMRLASIAFSALAVWLTYRAAAELRPGDSAFALLSAGLLGFNSMVLFMSGVVQNSTAALVSGIAVLYALSWGLRRGFTLRRWLIVGTAFALGLLLQTSTLTLAVPVGLTILAEAWRARRWQAVVTGALGMALPVGLLAGWWFARNHQLYGDWTANSTIAALWTYGPIMPFTEALYLVGTGLVGRFGQGVMIDFPSWIYWGGGVLVLISVAGGLRTGLGALRERSGGPPWPTRLGRWTRPDRFLWVLHGVTIVVVSISLIVYLYWYVHGLHGRYMFTAFPSILLFLARGWLAWFAPRWQMRAAMATSLAALALPIYGLFGLLIPTYALPPTATPEKLNEMTPVDANIGDTARIQAFAVNAAAARPGGELTVTVAWLPLSQTDVPYTVFVHLYDPERGSLAQRDIYPGRGNYATTVWDVGRPFVDTYRLALPPETPPTQARIVLGLYDQQTMQRLPVTGAQAGSPEEAWVIFGNIRIQP